MKKLLAMMLATVLMVTALQVPVSAAVIDDGAVEPAWVNTGTVHGFISFTDDCYGTAVIYVAGQTGTTSITCMITVYVLEGSEWEFVTDHLCSSDDPSLGGSCDFEANPGSSYKAEYEITVTRNNFDEVITHTVYEDYILE